MQKKQNSRLYAIVDASDSKAVNAVKAVLKEFSPKLRDGKTMVIGGSQRVLFVEMRKREKPVFDILQNLAKVHNLYPCCVIEEDKDLPPKSDKFCNGGEYHIVDCAVMDFSMPEGGFSAWQEKVRAIAKEIYRDDSVFLKMHAYKRDEDKSIHAIICNSENTSRKAAIENVVLGEEGWMEAVLKMAKKLDLSVKFRRVRYKNL